MQGAEPFAHPGGPGGALVLHGFTGNPQSMRPIAEALAADGLAVELPLLPGHGTDQSDMVDKRWADWSAAAEESLSDLRNAARRWSSSACPSGGPWLAGWRSATQR